MMGSHEMMQIFCGIIRQTCMENKKNFMIKKSWNASKFLSACAKILN